MKLVAIYLDTDIQGNDLLDSVGNNITAGWYVYAWPLDGEEPLCGPFDIEPFEGNHEKAQASHQ